MYIKRGEFLGSENSRHLHLKTPEGKSYEVNYISAFVWDMLDGHKSITEVAHEIEGKIQSRNEELAGIVFEVISDLEKVGLVKHLKL